MFVCIRVSAGSCVVMIFTNDLIYLLNITYKTVISKNVYDCSFVYLRAFIAAVLDERSFIIDRESATFSEGHP